MKHGGFCFPDKNRVPNHTYRIVFDYLSFKTCTVSIICVWVFRNTHFDKTLNNHKKSSNIFCS